MNIHPVVVHFPVALLTIYALMELIRFNKVKSQPYWFYVKALFLMIGGLGALAARQTGEWAAEGVDRSSDTAGILNMHENFANATTLIFGTLAVGYLIIWLNRENIFKFFNNNQTLIKIWNFILPIAKVLIETKLVILLAFAGLACVTITGGLGGIMVYGPDADPFFGFIYKLIFQ